MLLPESSANDTEPAWADYTCVTTTCTGGDTGQGPDAPVEQLEQVLVFVSDRDNLGGPRHIYAVGTGPSPDITPLTPEDNADDGSPSLCCPGVPNHSDPPPEPRPDPHVMAFDSNRHGNRDIYAMDLAKRASICQLTTDGAPDTNPDWSPDGKHIAFERRIGDETQIWAMEVAVNVDNGTCTKLGSERQVTANQPSSFEPSWFTWTTPAGDTDRLGHRIAFSGPEERADRNIHYVEQAYQRDSPPPTPFDALADITTATPFDEPSEDRGPSWSPRGDGLIFASNRGGGDFDIYFLHEETGTPVALTGEQDTGPGGRDDLNPAMQPLLVNDNVRPFKICGRACRARKRKAQRAQASVATVEQSDPRPKSRCTIRGSRRKERIRGSRRADVICGLGGDDTLIGLGGDDTLLGGTGRDKLLGRSGRDKLYGAAGRDKLYGGSGRDTLVGGPGPDRLSGGGSDDRSFGGGGRDHFMARGGGSDELAGGGGTDTAVVDRRDAVREVERRPR